MHRRDERLVGPVKINLEIVAPMTSGLRFNR